MKYKKQTILYRIFRHKMKTVSCGRINTVEVSDMGTVKMNTAILCTFTLFVSSYASVLFFMLI
jgi:hypothetical protein